MEDLTQLSGRVTELAYPLDTFYFLVTGAMVMWRYFTRCSRLQSFLWRRNRRGQWTSMVRSAALTNSQAARSLGQELAAALRDDHGVGYESVAFPRAHEP